MKKTFVQRINFYNIGKDCIQTTIPFENSMTIISQEGLLFHSWEGSDYYINKYLEDERRKQFPYSNIPTYYRKEGLFKKKTYVNQLFDFEKPYIEINDGSIIENFAVKDGNLALLIRNVMKKNHYTKHMTYDELLKFVEARDNESEQTYYINLDGAEYSDDKGIFPSEEKIYNHIKEQFQNNIRDFREYELKHSDVVSYYLKSHPWFLDYIEQSIKTLDYSLIDFNLGIGDDDPLIIIRVNDDNITVQGMSVTFVRQDDFKVDVFDVPVNMYTLEQLKFIPKIRVSREPKIPLRLNPGVTRETIQDSKRRIRDLKKQSL